MLIDLAIVMPVYNEEGCILQVVRSWLSMLSALDINFRIIILNDGSSDGTGEVLDSFVSDDRVEVINKPNGGHGPTILMGYRNATRLAEWTFQCDSDDEMKPDYFPVLWEKRESFDALFGCRKNRHQTLERKFITICSRALVHLLFGSRITDVNSPYRLIRSDILRHIVNQIPEDTFAPNVIISGALSRTKLSIYEHPVPYETRKTGQASIIKWKLWRSAARSLWQTLSCRPVLKTMDSQCAEGSAE